MTAKKWINSLREIGAEINSSPGLAPGSEEEIQTLPPGHAEFLRSVNGVTVYHGVFRLFGIGRPEPMLDITAWNSRETWRFAWDERVDPFVVFGETAWGDQYAYRREGGGGLGREVYFLESVMLRPEVIADSFEEFMDGEFLRNAMEPYDDMVVQTLNARGPIPVARHWAYAPSIALGGVESVGNVVELPAATAMIFAGDIASALHGSRSGSLPARVVPWTDEMGRDRLAISLD
jgi:hypothetical protein